MPNTASAQSVVPDPKIEDRNDVHVANRKAGNDHPLFGQWRIEVSPKRAAEKDYFLNMIQVGDVSLQSLPKTKCEDGKESVIVSFDYAGSTYTLTFDKTKQYGCKIKIAK